MSEFLMEILRLNSFSRIWKGSWALKKCVEAAAIGVVLVVGFSLTMRAGSGRNLVHQNHCHFPAIFNFGDSNSDTGSVSAAFHRVPYPNGETFFGKPSGRYSDGRLIIDFIADELGLPRLNAYLDSMGTNFEHGANFASSGSTIQPVDGKIFDKGFNPISLDIQISQFIQFKERSNELYRQVASSQVKSSFPRPEDFSNAFYSLDAGQNDLDAGFELMEEAKVKASIPNMINRFALAIEQLYQNGARTFWIHNTGPIGCLPRSLRIFPSRPGNVEQNGCLKSFNEVAQEFNKQLKDRVSQLRTELQEAEITYVDIFSAKYSLISNAKEHGFVNPLGYCCGHDGDYPVECGNKLMVNGTEVFGASCDNPSEYISWDGVHYTDAANRWVAKNIVDGSLSDPPLSITDACHKPVLHVHKLKDLP